MSKHAYLIIAGNEFKQLKNLIYTLDDIRNDIYIHIDKKVVFDKNYKDYLSSLVKYAKIYWIPRIEVNWAAPSQVVVELNLFKYAYNNENYSYFHLLSGKDLPLQSQNYIHNLLDNTNINLVGFTSEENYKKNKPWERVHYYHLFNKYSVRTFNNNLYKLFIRGWRFIEKKVQKNLAVNYWDKLNIKKVGYGTNWVSLTSDTVQLLLEEYDFWIKAFKNSIFGDELLIQTFILNSKKNIPLNTSLKDSRIWSLRFIDWEESDGDGPHIWRKKDYSRLIKAQKDGFLFARKFDSNVDNDIIQIWVKHLKKEDF